jgi:membrane protease YdiL (CAAX protease family)
MISRPPRRPSARERLQQRARADLEAELELDEEGLDEPEPDEWEESELAEGEGIRLTDPLYGYMVGIALSLGTTPLQPNIRYGILWTLLLALGAGVYLLGGRKRPEDADSANLAWGFGFGLVIGVPVLALLSPALEVTSRQLFPAMSDPAAYLALVFAMPIGETTFFRGAMQEAHGFRLAALAAGAWSLLLFLPNRTPAEALVIGITVFALSFAYAYVRQRNGLAAAWLCQIVVNVLLLFLPRLG